MKALKSLAFFAAGVVAGIYQKEIRNGVSNAYSAVKSKFNKCECSCDCEEKPDTADNFEAVK